MNTPFASGKTCNRCGGWDGHVAGFPNQSMFKLCTCCKHERPTMTNQYALGYKAGLEAAVKVCREYDASVWSHCNASSHAADMVSATLSQAIAALPVPSSSSEDCGEVQWRDIPEVAELLDTVWLMHEHLKLQTYYTEHHNIYDKANAVIAKFKEKQL